jgi:methionyl-tRNA synthetase
MSKHSFKLHVLTVQPSISALGNKLLQDNKLSNQLLAEDPARCRAVIGFGLNLIHLLANVLSPYMPEKAQSILRQLGFKAASEEEQRVPVHIPDIWEANALKPGHAIGTPELLFSTIPAAKVEEWREAFGGEELRKQKELEAEKAAAKKAAREKEKEKKRLKKAAQATQASEPNPGTTTTLPARPAPEPEEPAAKA